MAISPEAQAALEKAAQNVKQVPHVYGADDKARLLLETQILLLSAILTEIAQMRQEAKNA